ncbi:Gfo/Idh/MocA family oxidoreductase [Candidatus Laterigemmans baculatus]|uniref:Gfo/Idh/MocA family oxidoreductase n=1 Tax=Candidatus Laterigemmans baculatus TaxID=2770505 RepID=UPI0013DBC848|nr:Gfo/Idh/MocA family oxidoreductase [Candidatus Laterigemmans baculatus]
MNKVRFAVVGAGHLGKIHARLLQSVEGAEVVAITDPSDAARAAAAEQLGLPTYADHSQVLDRVDAAIVASPTDLHARIAADFLQAGKHVLVEKPITTTLRDAEMLVDLARRKRLTLQVGHVERFNPAWTAASEALQRPKYIEATRASSFPGRCLDVGVVMDLMIHDLDLVLSLTSAEVVDVQASGMAIVSDHEDIAEARVTFGCGLVAQFKASRISPTATRQMQIFGERGFVELDFSGPTASWVRPSQAILDRTFDLDSLGDPRGAREALFAEHLVLESPALEPRNAILDELHDFMISIQSGQTPTVSGADGARAVAVANQILSAIAAHQWHGAADASVRGPHARPCEAIEVASERIHRTRRAA